PELTPGTLPASLQTLVFRNFNYQGRIQSRTLPSSLTSLTFSSGWFDLPLAQAYLSPIKSLKTLTLGLNYNQPLNEGDIPPTVERLMFGSKFNQLITPGSMPNSITELNMGNSYNQRISVGSLPSFLKSLTFGYAFNQVLEPGTLPPSLTTLTLGYTFNQVIPPGTLPLSLTTLTFGNMFNQVIAPGTLPLSLTTLTLGERFNQVIVPGMFPESLHTLISKASNHIYQTNPDADTVYPKSFTSMTLSCQISPGSLPSSLSSLVFLSQPYLIPGSLPQSLVSLEFPKGYNEILDSDVLPQSLRRLKIGMFYKKNSGKTKLTGTLSHLTLDSFKRIDKLDKFLGQEDRRTHLVIKDIVDQRKVTKERADVPLKSLSIWCAVHCSNKRRIPNQEAFLVQTIVSNIPNVQLYRIGLNHGRK
ncbi:hypothetical protein SAMD00019534_023000, partial [Acytostelium subglobosum LB1]|uniref:hypothetical protein n=1 Tax=Acytostelium subglobosum LB1 TaxID=1410327 RepID=UPI00064490CB